jgi:hypothetical protein
MANIRAAQTGIFSNTTTWVGGVVPTSVDNVYSNTYTVTIDTNITVAKISNIAENGASAGGKFVVDSNVIIKANVQTGTTVCLEVSNDASPTINGNVIGGTAALGRALDNLGNGTVSVSGTVTGGNVTLNTTNNTNGQHAEAIRNSSSGTISLTGNVNGGIQAYCASIVNVSDGNLTITGNVSGSGTSATAYSIRHNNTSSTYGTITIDGNVYGSYGIGVSFPSNTQGNLTINGNCYGASDGGASAALNLNNVTGDVNIYGNVDGGSGTVSNQIGVVLAGSSAANVNIVGNCVGGRSKYLTNNLTGKHAVNVTGSNSVNITGNVEGGPNTSINNWTLAGTSYGLNITGASTVNVTGDTDIIDAPSNGDIALNNASAVLNFTGNIYDTHPANNASNITNITNSAGTLNITGNVYGKDQNFASPTAETNYSVNQTGTTSTTTVVGNVYGGITGCGIRAAAGSVYIKKVIGNDYGITAVAGAQRDAFAGLAAGITAKFIVEEIEVGSQGNFPISGPLFLNKNINNVQITLKDPDDYNTTRTLIDATSATNLYPLSGDVRYGISYAGGNLTGSCYVPSASSVSYNIPVDNTTGQAILSIDSLLNFDVTEIGSNSIWKRLKNCSTVASVGAQLTELS